MSYFIGTSPSDVINSFIKRYFYGLRRNVDGELFLVVADQLAGGDSNSVVINDIGVAAENYLDFEEGIDFLGGIDEDHNILYANLRYPQIRWDNRSILYIIENDTGYFTQKLSQGATFIDNISSPAYGDGADTDVLTSITPYQQQGQGF